MLPARFPNLLVNGSGGIAVGMATNMAPHNLGEVIDACLATIAIPPSRSTNWPTSFPVPISRPAASSWGAPESSRPSIPAGARFVLRARVHTEELRREREALIVTEIPYQINKSVMIERIAELVREKKIEGISDIRDESSRAKACAW